MEDGWLLAQLVEFYLDRYDDDKTRSLADALALFDDIRSPYYHRMYDVMDNKPKDGKIDYTAWSPTPGGPLSWIYDHDIGKEWEEIRQKL